MSGIRKLEGTHRSLGRLVCNRCGYKVGLDALGRSAMRNHLAVHADREQAAADQDEAQEALLEVEGGGEE